MILLQISLLPTKTKLVVHESSSLALASSTHLPLTVLLVQDTVHVASLPLPNLHLLERPLLFLLPLLLSLHLYFLSIDLELAELLLHLLSYPLVFFTPRLCSRGSSSSTAA